MRLQSFFRHINLLNILLLGIIAAMVFYALSFFHNFKINIAIPQNRAPIEKQEIQTQTAQAAPITDYAIISEQNIFHPERKIPPEKKTEQQLPKPEFVLYGTLIDGDTKIAYIEDLKAPHTTGGRGKRQRALHLGQNLSGYVVKEIHHDKVTMAKGDEIIDVKIGDNKRKKPVETASPAPAAQPAPDSSLRDKPEERRLPPGIVQTQPPPAGASVPDEKAISRVKGALGSGIKKRPGAQ